MYPIAVTPEEYWTIGFIFFMIGMFGTAHFLFLPPHERDDDEEL